MGFLRCPKSSVLHLLQHIATIVVFDIEVNDMATSSIRLDKELVEKATIMAKALNRTPPKQIEHWAKIGEIMEDNPDLPYEFVKKAIIAKAEAAAGKLENYSFD